jgi:Ca2+-binding RTX toxin-like protein
MNTAVSTSEGIFFSTGGVAPATEIEIGFDRSTTDITVGADGTLFILRFGSLLAYDAVTEETTTLYEFDGLANGLVQDANGDFYVSYADGNRIDVFAAEGAGGPIRTIDYPAGSSPFGPGSSGDMVVEGNTLYLLTLDNAILTFDLVTGQLQNTALHDVFGLFGMSTSEDGLVAYGSDRAYLIDPQTGDIQDLGRVPGLDGSATGAAQVAETYNFAGTADDDTLFGSLWNDEVTGDAGNDVISGLSGDDGLSGQRGDDILNGNEGRDTLRGGLGEDSLFGDEGRDVLRGQSGRDQLFGGDGDDNAKGGGGADTVSGEDGNDFVTGGTRADLVLGGRGQDRLFGNRDDDVLSGERGNDVLKGGGGDDTLDGGSGDDFLKGGSGADVFEFMGQSTGRDRIVDFEDGIDLIRMTGLTFDDVDIADVALGTQIGTSAGDVVLLGVESTQITEEDFLF